MVATTVVVTSKNGKFSSCSNCNCRHSYLQFAKHPLKELLCIRKVLNEWKSLYPLPLLHTQMTVDKISWIYVPLVVFFQHLIVLHLLLWLSALELAFSLETFVPNFLVFNISYLIFRHPFPAICIKWFVSLSLIYLKE